MRIPRRTTREHQQNQIRVSRAYARSNHRVRATLTHMARKRYAGRPTGPVDLAAPLIGLCSALDTGKRVHHPHVAPEVGGGHTGDVAE